MMNIAAQIPPRAKRVVELGVSREKAGEAFLRIQPKAEYWGITDNLEELKEAGRFLTHAAYALPEEVDFGRLGIYEADVIIIRNAFFRGLTAERLRKWTESLAEDGQLILDIPNPAYIRNYLELLAGQRPGGASEGLSVSAAKRLLSEAGLHTLSAQAIYATNQDREMRQGEESLSLQKSLKAMLGKLGVKTVRENDPWLQSFLFKAGKKPLEQKKRLHIQAALGEALVCAPKRVNEPNAFMMTDPTVTAQAAARRQQMEPVPEGVTQKVLLRQRMTYASHEQAFQLVDVARKDGWLLVTEMDDNPGGFGAAKLADAQVVSYMATHCMQVSTEALAEIMRQYNPHVKVFPNHLKELPPKRDYAAERLQKQGKDDVTFFFGALNRTQEWQEVMPVLRGAIEKYGSRLRFKVLSDRGFFEALPTEHKEFIGSKEMYDWQFVPYYVYTAALHSSDIAFLPLRETPFNRTKSDLKFIESAGHGAVVLASPTVYEGTVKDGRNGFIYRNPREFKEYLTLLIEDRARRIETAEAAWRYVRDERLLSSHYLERLDWYREMLARRPELDREMMQRLSDWQQRHR